MNNRVIKFRVWDVAICKYIDVYDIDSNGQWVHVAQGDQYYLTNSSEKIEFILEQFTGFYDKNGKEIYEGDILAFLRKIPFGYVEFGPVPGEIEEEPAYGWGLTPFKRNSSWLKRYPIENGGSQSVFGNIHENPELLK